MAEKFTGGTITQADGFFYHVFTESGTLTKIVDDPVDVDVLVVAGGGGGGTRRGGGGGAGGVLVDAIAISEIETAVVVGAGGGGGSQSRGQDGEASEFGEMVAAGGGAGGYGENDPVGSRGGDGGSGGGGGGAAVAGQGEGGDGTAGQGNDGGDGFLSSPASPRTGGGGGGAGVAGANGASVSPGGDGGEGVELVQFSAVGGTPAGWFGGGGGGGCNDAGATPGAGGSGGGGSGLNTGAAAAPSGEDGTGGGGGGAGNTLDNIQGGSGGSGIVIIRYVAEDPGPPEGWQACSTPPATEFEPCPTPADASGANFARDESLHERHGTYEGEPVLGVPGLFPGSAHALLAPDAPTRIVREWEPWMHAISVGVEMWINLPDVQTTTIIARMGGAPEGPFVLFVSGGLLRLQGWHTGGSTTLSSNVSLEPNTPYQVASRLVGGTGGSPGRTIIVNGVVAGSSIGPGGSNGFLNEASDFRVMDGIGIVSDVSVYVHDTRDDVGFADMVAAHYAARNDPEVAGESAYRSAVLADDPELYWRFHEGRGWEPCPPAPPTPWGAS